MKTIARRPRNFMLATGVAIAGVLCVAVACMGAASTSSGASSPKRDKSPTGDRSISLLDASGGRGATPSGDIVPDIRKIVDFVAAKDLYPISLETAAQKLRPVAEVRRESPTPGVVLMAGSGPGVRRIEVSYSQDSAGQWEFSQLTVMLTAGPGADVPVLFRRIASRLRKNLGKPLFVKSQGDPLPRMGWKLRGTDELWLAEETSTLLPDTAAPQRHIRIDVASPAGESD